MAAITDLEASEIEVGVAAALAATPLTATITGALPAGTALIGKVGIDQTTPGTTNKVAAVLVAGTALVGSVGIDQTTDGTTNKVAATQATASNLNAQVVGDIAAAASDSGNPVKMGGLVSTTSPAALTTGKRQNFWSSPAGQMMVGFGVGGFLTGSNTPTLALDAASAARPLGVTPFVYNGATTDAQKSGAAAAALATGVGSASVEEVGRSFKNIAGATGGLAVKNSAGHLHSLTINTKGAATATATLYDNTAASGTVIATIDLTLGQGTLIYDLAFSTGLFVVVTATLSDITLSYR
jgi:hypothetical protein